MKKLFLIVIAFATILLSGCNSLGGQVGGGYLAGRGIASITGGNPVKYGNYGAAAGAVNCLLLGGCGQQQQQAFGQIIQGQQQPFVGPQQQGQQGCVQATVDGRPGCYDLNYLRTLQQTGGQQQPHPQYPQQQCTGAPRMFVNGQWVGC